VRVPCSTSNLGPGFDTLGLALDKYLVATYTPGPSPLGIHMGGTLLALEGGAAPDLLATSFTLGLEEAGVKPTGEIVVHSEIPVARGLGSSAAAYLAGLDLARAVTGQAITKEAYFLETMRREGHGDNAASCTFGGFQAMIPSADGPLHLELPVSENVGFAYAAPAAGVSTAAARRVLPRHLSYGVAVAQLGRITALLRGMADGDPRLIRIGIEDELHVPHRLPLIPGAYKAVAAGYDEGAWAVTISGSGSGLMAMCPLEAAERVAAAMRDVFAAGGDSRECVGFALRPDWEGIRRMG
jgi:homoserine kinase